MIEPSAGGRISADPRGLVLRGRYRHEKHAETE
jgi:hypothetical protein